MRTVPSPWVLAVAEDGHPRSVDRVLIVDHNASFRAVAKALPEAGEVRVVGEAGTIAAALSNGTPPNRHVPQRTVTVWRRLFHPVPGSHTFSFASRMA
jgi:hypothetical protein